MLQGKELQAVGYDLVTEQQQTTTCHRWMEKNRDPLWFPRFKCCSNLYATFTGSPDSSPHPTLPTTSRCLLQVRQPYQAPPDPSRAMPMPATGPLHLLLPERKAASSTSFISMHPAPPRTEHCAAPLHGPGAVNSKGTSLFFGGVRSPGPIRIF